MKNKKQIIRSSKHTIKFANTGKIDTLDRFIDEYSLAVTQYVDYIWENDIIWLDKNKQSHLFSIQNESYDIGSFLDYKVTSFPTSLSARALSSAITQSVGIVKAHTSKILKMQYRLQNMESDVSVTEKKISNYKQRIEKVKQVQSIDLKNVYPELSSKCCSFVSDDRQFNGWIKLYSLGPDFPSFYIPIKMHCHANKLKESFNMMTSFLIAHDHIDIRWNQDKIYQTDGLTIGADPGINRICTFSHIENQDSDEYKDCLKKICKKRKNSKAYLNAIKQRTSTVNHFINNIDLNGVKQINLENNSNIHHKNYKGNFLSHYAYAEIRNKINSVAEQKGVLVVKQSSYFKSQRCSNCGWTQRDNRNGTSFHCPKCNLSIDADYNSSINQTCELSWLPSAAIGNKYNIQGFFWNSIGILSEFGTEFKVPYSDLQCIN